MTMIYLLVMDIFVVKPKKPVVVVLIKHHIVVLEIQFVVCILMVFTPIVMQQVMKNVGLVFMQNFVYSMKIITTLSEQELMMHIV